MNLKVATYLEAQHMISPGDHVICAVSGGKDSMVLLHVLCSLAPRWNLTVTAAHMNHQLRGKESLRDVSFVRDYCANAGIPVQITEADVSGYAQTHRLSVEAAARHLRYAFLLSLDPDAKVATAHTAEDNLETLLMHLLRGSSLHGLTGIPPVRGPIIRPLLTVSRREIDAYLTAHELPHVEDSTNQADDCLRNRLRHHVLPLLAAENPDLANAVTRLTQSLRQEDTLLEQMAQCALDAALTDEILSLCALRTHPEAIQYRMLRMFLAPVPNLSARHLDAALSLCQNGTPSAKYSLPGGYTLTRSYDTLRLLKSRPLTAVPAQQALALDRVNRFGPWEITCRRSIAPAHLPHGTFALSLEALLRLPLPGAQSLSPEALIQSLSQNASPQSPSPEAPIQSLSQNASIQSPLPDVQLPLSEALTQPLILRPRRPGDRITLEGGTKKLGRLLIDLKIPAHQRDYLPVLETGGTILAVLPWKCAAFCCAAPGSDSLILTVKRMED